jgi:hypothetical protein
LVLERFYSDEAEKATAVEKRDAFADMLSELRHRFPPIYDPTKREQRAKEKPFGLVCWKSNRPGRDLVHTRHVKSDLRLRAVTIVSPIPLVETGNAGLDTLIESFYEYQDEQLLREISDNARRGLAQLVTMRDTEPEFWPTILVGSHQVLITVSCQAESRQASQSSVSPLGRTSASDASVEVSCVSCSG